VLSAAGLGEERGTACSLVRVLISASTVAVSPAVPVTMIFKVARCGS
jgi:hypothetical protein